MLRFSGLCSHFFVDRYWPQIVNFFILNQNEDGKSIPGKIGDLDAILNATISHADNGVRVNFKKSIRNDLLNAVKSTYDQPQIGFQKESNKINVLYIKGPKELVKPLCFKRIKFL